MWVCIDGIRLYIMFTTWLVDNVEVDNVIVNKKNIFEKFYDGALTLTHSEIELK
jgi:hypothetical protein